MVLEQPNSSSDEGVEDRAGSDPNNCSQLPDPNSITAARSLQIRARSQSTYMASVQMASSTASIPSTASVSSIASIPSMVSVPSTSSAYSMLSIPSVASIPGTNNTARKFRRVVLGVQDGEVRYSRDNETMALERKALAVDTRSPITDFILAQDGQGQSLFFSRLPAEAREMIYKLCGIESGKVHLYEQRGNIVGDSCEEKDVSQPCLGSSLCHRVDGQINEVSGGRHGWRFAQKNRASLPCPSSCSCRSIGLPGLILTCQHAHSETLAVLYHTKTFVIHKAVFATVLSADVVVRQHALSNLLAHIRRLQLDLGFAFGGTIMHVQSKHATLRAVQRTAIHLKELSVVFTTHFRGTGRCHLDSTTIRLLSVFRGLDKFSLVLQNARDTVQNSDIKLVIEDELEFARAVPFTEKVFEKFVKLRDMADTTGLDAVEKAMAKSASRFEKELKKQVKVMLAGE